MNRTVVAAGRLGPGTVAVRALDRPAARREMRYAALQLAFAGGWRTDLRTVHRDLGDDVLHLDAWLIGK